MSRARSARVGVFASSSPRLQDLRALVGRYMPETELLRRLVPILLATFAFVAIVGFAFQLAHGKRDALDAARRQLTLYADVAALNLKDKTLSSSRDWQTALEFVANGLNAVREKVSNTGRTISPINTPIASGKILRARSPKRP